MTRPVVLPAHDNFTAEDRTRRLARDVFIQLVAAQSGAADKIGPRLAAVAFLAAHTFEAHCAARLNNKQQLAEEGLN